MPCKYARGKYNMTPNDYDFTFNFSEIPSNIAMESADNLSARLQDLMPLSKVLHLNLETRPDSYMEKIMIISNNIINTTKETISLIKSLLRNIISR